MNWESALETGEVSPKWLVLTEKKCPRCGETKPREAFGWKRSRKWFYPRWCYPCESQRSLLWIANNPEKHYKRVQRWRRANPEKVIAASKVWQENNPERTRANNKVSHLRRQTRERELPFDWTKADEAFLKSWWGNHCSFCGGDNCGLPFDLEHFVAQSNGGPFVPRNILLGCKKCNSSKWKHDPEEWIYRRFGVVEGMYILDTIDYYFENVRQI